VLLGSGALWRWEPASRLNLTDWAKRYDGPHSGKALRTSLAEAGMAERIREATRRRQARWGMRDSSRG